MKQKLNIARALLSNPSLYLLDEPATHLDPLAREDFWEFIETILLKKEGATVLLCTHDLEEAATLADYIALLHEGRIVAQGDPAMLRRLVQEESYYQLSYVSLPQKWKREVQSLIHSEEEGQVILQVEESELSSLVESFLQSGGLIREIKKKEPLLMDIMKHFIGGHHE
jgi:ABC-2 type transport system ATP-binding protein